MLDVADESITVKPRFDNSTPMASASTPPPGAKAITLTNCFVVGETGSEDTLEEAHPASVPNVLSVRNSRRCKDVSQ